MRITVISALVVTLLLLSNCQRENPPTGVLARVDRTVITLEDFNREFEGMKLESQYSPGGHEAIMRMKEEFLNQLIHEALIKKAAKRLGISVTDQELEQEIMKAKSDHKGESLREYLNSQDVSFDQWKEHIRERILIEKTIRVNCRCENDPTTEEAHTYYEAHRDKYTLPERVKARQIVVASKRNANKILRELKKGAVFEQLAVENSLGPEGRYGGDLGYFARGDMPEEFNVVFTMEEGNVSEPVQTPYGFHIFKVEDRKPARQLVFEEVKDDIKRKITELKSERLYYQWLEELKKNAKIEINHRLLEYTL